MVYQFFDKKPSGSGVAVCEPNDLLANEIQRQIIRKFKKRKVYSSFRDNIWSVDLADMQSFSKYGKGIKYLLCAIDLFSKYVWVVPLKYKRGITVFNGFQKIISKGRKPNKICVNQDDEFYNNLFETFLKNSSIEMYLTFNKGKSIVAERFIMTLKNQLFKHVTAVSKSVYFDLLDNTVNKYNSTVHRTIKMKPIDVGSDSYAEYNEDSNENNPNFKVGDHVRIPKCKNIFDKGYTQNWSDKVFLISKIKNIVQWTYVISDLNGELITGTFYEKELQKTSQKKYRVEKVIKRKGDKL